MGRSGQALEAAGDLDAAPGRVVGRFPDAALVAPDTAPRRDLVVPPAVPPVHLAPEDPSLDVQEGFQEARVAAQFVGVQEPTRASA
jgi:hypothetical protein